MKIKIRGGSNSEDLCKTCTKSHIFETDTHEVTRLCYCNREQRVVLPEKVVKCDSYNENKEVDIYDMRLIAWVLRTDKTGKHIGFTPYNDLPKDEKEEMDTAEPFGIS